LAVSDAGAEDFEMAEDLFIITTPPDRLYAGKEKIDQMGVACEEAELEMIPKTFVECNSEAVQANTALIEWLEALDDVDAVYHNMKIGD
jgi:transcriptional/translational regulatory protein YebC/TACO1